MYVCRREQHKTGQDKAKQGKTSITRSKIEYIYELGMYIQLGCADGWNSGREKKLFQATRS